MNYNEFHNCDELENFFKNENLPKLTQETKYKY